jgi:hypothetical protein
MLSWKCRILSTYRLLQTIDLNQSVLLHMFHSKCNYDFAYNQCNLSIKRLVIIRNISVLFLKDKNIASKVTMINKYYILVFLTGSDRVPVFGWSQTLVNKYFQFN